jgi:hypothetical protein
VEVIDTHSRGTVIEGCTPLADDDPLRHHLPERVRRGAAQDLHRITPGWLTHVPVDLGRSTTPMTPALLSPMPVSG